MTLSVQGINRVLNIDNPNSVMSQVPGVIASKGFTLVALTTILLTGSCFIISAAAPVFLVVGVVVIISSCVLSLQAVSRLCYRQICSERSGRVCHRADQDEAIEPFISGPFQREYMLKQLLAHDFFEGDVPHMRSFEIERVVTQLIQKGTLESFITQLVQEGKIKQGINLAVREQNRDLERFISRLLQLDELMWVITLLVRQDSFDRERRWLLYRKLQGEERWIVLCRLIAIIRDGGCIDLHPRINPAHLWHSRKVQGGATVIPKGCKLDRIHVSSIVDLFEAMNTTVKFDDDLLVRSDYIDRESSQVISDAGQPINYNQATTAISTLVDQIEQRSEFMGVPINDCARESFYTQLETFLKVIIYEIQSGNHDASLCNDIILQLVTAVGHCGARYMSVLSEGHGRLTLRAETHSFEDLVLEEFHKIRHTIVMEITNNHRLGRGVEQPHVLNRHMMNLGCIRGLRNGSNLGFVDQWDVNIMQLHSVRVFDRIYTPQHIQECFDEMVNGVQVMKEDGHSFDPPRFESGDLVIGKPMASEWLGEHVPLDWNPSIRNATGSIIPLTNKQIEALFGPGFDDEQERLVQKSSRYQQIIGADRSREIRAQMFRIACITTVGDGNIKSVACSYILQQLGVLNSDINGSDFYMDVDVLSNLFACGHDNLNNADIKF